MNNKSIGQIKCLFTLLLTVCLNAASLTAFGQAASVTIKMDNVRLIQVMEEIENQTNYLFLYSKDVDTQQVVSVEAMQSPVSDVLTRMLAGTNILYNITNSNILLTPRQDAKHNTGEIRGVVKNDKGEPLVGALIVVKGTSTGTSTNLDGSYALRIPENINDPVLVISYVGIRPVEVVVGPQTFISTVMEESAVSLDNVVVTALGIRRSEKALSYNVQQVAAEEITMVKDANFINSLIGKVAGVQINSASTGAGGASRVVMRGLKSINSSNLALYVIDGVPMYNLMNGGDAESNMADQPGTDGVADINPEDIESISMLTGPSAAALYGNAAAAGVVLITTKKGMQDKTVVSVSNSTTFSKVYKMPEMQSKYGNLRNEIGSWGDVVNSSYDPKDFFRTGSNVINSVSLSTGNRKNQTYISAASTNSRNILPNSEYNRYNFTARNTTTFFREKMTLDFGARLFLQDDNNMMAQGLYFNPLPGLYLFPRSENFDDVRAFERYNAGLDIMQQYWPYGNVTMGMQNPYWVQHRELRQNDKTRYMLNASLKYQITDWLDVIGRVNVDNYNNRTRYRMYASTDPLFSGVNGTYRDVQAVMKTTYADVLATVNKTFNDWNLHVNAGASINDSQYETLGYDGGLVIPNFFAVHNINFEDGWKPTQSGWHDQSQAVFANVELGWRSMAYLTLTGRNDWESQLAFSDYTSFFYPSVGLSGILTSMFEAPQWLSYLKVRASYTEVGNSYDRFMTTTTYPFNQQNMSWTTSTDYPNTNLKPERTKSWEIGMDMRLFNNLALNVTYYYSNTYNQTFYASLSSSSGYTRIPIQSGNIENRGIELSLGYDKQWKDFSLSTHYTFSWNENRVKRLADGAYNFVTGEPILMQELSMGGFGSMDARLLLRVGGSMGDAYGQQILKRDLNGYILDDPNTGIQLMNKETYLGSILPKSNMGWSTRFGYKGINLGATFTARLGGIVISETQSYLDSYGVSKTSADLRNQGGVPVNQGYVSAQKYFQTISGTAYYYTYSATNVRLGELSLSYTLPKKWFDDNLRMTVGVVGRNLWMIYCKAPFDPELTSAAGSNYYQGFDSYTLPSTRNMGINVSIQF